MRDFYSALFLAAVFLVAAISMGYAQTCRTNQITGTVTCPSVRDEPAPGRESTQRWPRAYAGLKGVGPLAFSDSSATRVCFG